MTEIITFIKIFLIFLIIDIPVITYLNKDMYNSQFFRIQGPLKIESTRLYLSGFIAYLLLTFAIYHFAIKQKSILNAFYLGLCIYGIYNMTNLATINKWGVREAILDTLWGTSLLVGITWIYLTYL
jgi:uncharacterized membrane protein